MVELDLAPSNPNARGFLFQPPSMYTTYMRLQPTKLVATALLGCLCWLFSSVPAQAQTTTFEITPALINLSVDPGDQKVFDITLHNRSQTSQAIRAYTRNFSTKGIEGEITFADDNTMSYAAASWLHLSATELIIPANGQEKITAQLIVPPQAEPGGKYASVLFEQIVADSGAGIRDSQVNVATRMSTLIFLTVSGDVIEAGQVLAANANGQCSNVVCGLQAPSFVDKGPLDFQFIFNNTGNVHVRPRGYITITQFGRQVARLTVDDRAVLPNSQRRFVTQWQRSLLLGPYQAELHLTYGTNSYTLTETTNLWAFPWQGALVLGLVAVVVTGLVLSRKYFRLQRLKNQ